MTNEMIDPKEVWAKFFETAEGIQMTQEDFNTMNAVMIQVLGSVKKHKVVPMDIFNYLYEDHVSLMDATLTVFGASNAFNSSCDALKSNYKTAKSHLKTYHDVLYKKIGPDTEEQE